jgi:hypothetical protein
MYVKERGVGPALWVLSLAVMFVLLGCAGDEEGSSSAESSEGDAQAAQTAEAGDTGDTDSGDAGEEPEGESAESTESADGDTESESDAEADSAAAGSAPEFKSATFRDWELEWRVEGENLAVRISYPGTGWVALGFEPSRMMQDADIVIGYVSDDGEVTMTDQYGTGTTAHQLDSELGGSDDLTQVQGSEAEGRTTLSFVKPLDSGDEYDKALTPGEQYQVIVARGPDGQDDMTSYHAGRGGFEITL